jgi:hypothetical protein
MMRMGEPKQVPFVMSRKEWEKLSLRARWALLVKERPVLRVRARLPNEPDFIPYREDER